jgi:ABC-type transport system substrate-binding protein
MFLSGLLDGFGLNKAYFDTYGSSSRKYSATGAATFYGIVLSDYDSLVEREAVLNKTTYDENYNGATQQYNKTILSIKEFRQALCYALDRRSLITNLYPGGSPAISLFSDLIIADPENGTAFNSFDSTKAAICEFWGVTYGEDGEFDTLDEAYAAITGYDMTSAKRLVDVAVAKAKEAGLMGDNTIVKIDYCCSSDSETEQLWYNTLKDCFLEMVKGTALEGKFEFNYDYSLGSDFSKGIQNGLADTAWGFGWQGGELDPYSLVEVYVDGASGAEEPYQYDMWIDRSSIEYNITLSFDIDGDDTAEEYTYSVYDWYRILNGQAEDDEDLPNWRFGKVADSVRAEVLAALEKAILGDYTSIPMMNQGSIQLLSYKINFGKETYMFGMGFGGIRYITYNYTDGQWAEWVASQGGSLNYK